MIEPQQPNSTPCSSSETTSWRLDQLIESDPDNCAVIVSQTLRQLEQCEWSSRDVFAIHMSLEEGILNAIRHGNCCNPEKRVHIVIELDRDNFYAQISDEGKGFCLADVPDPTQEENLEKTSGRGVMLIKTFMDRVVYNTSGNSVELFKRKRAAGPSSED
jgi:serine/threonine-protein kinase RsbW